jgi:DNA-binding NarL/FixJ family response regulator
MFVVADLCSGAEAGAAVLRHPPDVVLLDCPDAVRALHPYAPVVVLTCDEDPDEAVRALTAGASGYLSKDLELDARSPPWRQARRRPRAGSRSTWSSTSASSRG